MKIFWDKAIEKPTGCWEWQGSLTKSGYGRFWLEHKTKRAHRVAWELKNGTLADDICVLHKCDNRKCVNPDHLFLGTHKDNAVDREAKGRGADRHGEKHPGRKLNAVQVGEIRELYANGEVTQDELARRYAVAQAQVWRILRKVNW